ncbi:sulfur carrier protein ThiS [Natronospirillum operosum]|uniref:Sulfur carrier protein ThiS n=1 Tax=Natronospirillum operosum TaxID=2759953 RepID=A0A4Z0WBD6_9GAMM|nr:sulfur carrier protein ThiS [Natronospirillum operosum]TGG90416.1 sulfur carrier protein ThiS [Natronospirillum operosum]
MSTARQTHTEQDIIKVSVQGARHRLPAGQTLSDALTELGLIGTGSQSGGVALAVNQEVVPASEWPQRTLVDGDQIQLFQAIAGG